MSYRNLIFLHIPKAAGTTLHSILESHYPPENTHSIYDPDLRLQGSLQRGRVRSVSRFAS